MNLLPINMVQHVCGDCGLSFTQINNLTRHRKNVHEAEKKFSCSKCSKQFSRKDAATRHEKNCKQQQQPPSSGAGVKRKTAKRSDAGPSKRKRTNYKVVVTQTAFDNAAMTWKLKYPENDSEDDYIGEIGDSVESMREKITTYQKKRRALKVNMSLHVKFEKATDPSIVTEPPIVFVCEQFEVYEETNIDEVLDAIKEQLINRIEVFEMNGSGWIVSRLVALDTTVWLLDPLRGSTYHALPQWIQNKKSVVNVKNLHDNKCFQWSVLAGLEKPTSPTNKNETYSYTKYVYENKYNFSMLPLPVPLKDIPKFEKKNNVSINVYGVDEIKKKKSSKKNPSIDDDMVIEPDEDDMDIDESDDIQPRKRRNRRIIESDDDDDDVIPSKTDSFILDQADVEGDDSDDDDDEVDDDGDLEGFICDDESEDDTWFYRNVDIEDIGTRGETDDVNISDVKSVNKEGIFYPLKVTKHEVKGRHVNLLLTEQDGVKHYSTITDFSRLVGSQYTKNRRKHFYCYSCLHGFKGKKGEKSRDQCTLLNEHYKLCKTVKPQRVEYPDKDKDETTLRFTNVQKQLRDPFAVYADFECKLNPIAGDIDVSTGIVPPSTEQKTKKEEKAARKEIAYQLHEPASFGIKVTSIDPNFKHEVETGKGVDAAEKFLDKLQEISSKIYEEYIKKPKKMIELTVRQKEEFGNATTCHICEEYFVKGVIPRHHCHKEFEDESTCEICVGDFVKVVIPRHHCHNECENEFTCQICAEDYVKVAIPRQHCHNEFETKSTCQICVEDSVKKADVIVRDHCHITGQYRGPAHANCNLRYKIDKRHWKLPVFMHNLRGYDSHLIIKAIKERHGPVRVIPTNMEKFMSFSVGQLQFIDTMQFTMQSLDNLVKTLKSNDDFSYTRQEFSDDKEFALMKKKGVFPYDFFDDISKILSDEEMKFPTRETFFNKLEDNECSEKDYLHAKLVWKTFGCKTFANYHDIYLKSDVTMLADFFEKFRTMCLDSYRLDPAHYYSAPGLAWDAALRMTKVNLELFDNEEMYSFIEHSIRGGVTMITKRLAKANNDKCKVYDPTKPLSWLIYLDANNLYGWAMSQSLPTHGFKWLSREEIEVNFSTADDILKLLDDADDGFIFEVDLEYPESIHDLHNDYPLAPERVVIDETMLSPLQHQFPKGQLKPQTKLTPNLRDKTKYVVHYRNLKFYLEHGMILTKVHRVLSFKQSPWLKKYIDYNTECRKISTSLFEKDFYKLMNNSVFGKTQENLRNRVNVEVLTRRDIALKRIAKPTFIRSQLIREDLVIIQCAKTTLKLNKPIYVGFSVLDLSKLLMYSFHYNKMLEKYDNDSINLCFTDTDSLLYEIKTKDIYADMLDNKELYDFSDYPTDHKCYSTSNKKKIGKFKDELKSVVMEEFVGLRPKCYSLLFNGEVEDNILKHTNLTEKQTAKGTKKSVKKKHLRHVNYKNVHRDLSTVVVKQNVIKSKAHTISTYHTSKVALTAFDTKRWICDDNIHTLALGHRMTRL